MFPRSVLITRRVRVHVRTLRDGCVHTFWTYEVRRVHKFKKVVMWYFVSSAPVENYVTNKV